QQPQAPQVPASRPPAPRAPSTPAFQAPQHQQHATPVPPVPPAPGPVQEQAGHEAAASEDAQRGGAWGFSTTTEGAFERLAAEPQAPRSAPPLGAPVPPQPFSWPESQDEAEARSGSRDRSHDAQSAPIVLPEPPGPTIFDRPSDPEPAADSPAAPEQSPAPEPEQPFAADSPAAEASAAGSPANQAPVVVAPAAPAAADDDEDRTVVVARRARWGIELPDGEVLGLEGDDVVVGRRPEVLTGAVVLQIADPTRTMSKSHARLRRHGEDWTIEDLHSTNGVSVIDEHGATVPLEPGREYEVIEDLIIGTLEVKLRRIG
ncbi:MAG: FHA domain-containing protein, partial [Leucobacter sp.]